MVSQNEITEHVPNKDTWNHSGVQSREVSMTIVQVQDRIQKVINWKTNMELGQRNRNM